MGTHLNRAERGELLADGSTRAVLDGLRHVVRTLREASREAERTVGLSAAQLFVLHRLAGGGPLSVNDLAARTFTHQSSVSVVVAKLARRGLVARARAEGDARRLEISLTPAGRAVLSRAPAATQERLIDALARLGRPTRDRLARDLQRLLEVMGVEAGPAPMLFESPAPSKRRVRGA
jgi:DNA-binding MarR family transcriptional regulator